MTVFKLGKPSGLPSPLLKSLSGTNVVAHDGARRQVVKVYLYGSICVSESRGLMGLPSMGMWKEKMNLWSVPNLSLKDCWYSIFASRGFTSVKGEASWSWGKLPLGQFLVFNQELLALVKSGLPILRIWDLLIERAGHAGFQRTLRDVREDIRGGASASEALAKHPVYFPELYVATVKAGEQSGNLPEVLQRYVAYLKLMVGLRQKVKKALSYPIVLIAIGVAVVGFLLTYVMPTFVSVYGESAKTLPWATQVLLDIVTHAESRILPAAVVIIGIMLGDTCLLCHFGRTAGDRSSGAETPARGSDCSQTQYRPADANARNYSCRRNPARGCFARRTRSRFKPMDFTRNDRGRQRDS